MITKLFGATILLPLIFSFGLDAQSSKPDQLPATDKPDAQSPLSNQPLGQDYDRPVSWKLVVPNILADQKAIWLSPSKVAKDHNWIPALCIAGATAALFTLDPYQGRYFHTTSTFQGFNGVFTGNATGLGIIIAPVSLYVTGLARRDTKMQHTALLAGEAVADAEIVTTVLKDIDQRARPVTFTPHRNYWHSWFESKGFAVRRNGSFPYGHAIAAFSVAAVVAHRYRTLDGCHTSLTEWPAWWVSPGSRYQLTSRRTYLPGLCLATLSAALQFFVIKAKAPLDRSLALLSAILLFAPFLLKAQLTSGLVEGTVHDAEGHVASQTAILIAGGSGFKAVLHTNSAGQFTLCPPYERYLLSSGISQQRTGVAVVIAPLQTSHVHLIIDSSGELRSSPPRQPSRFGRWPDDTCASTFPEGFSLQSALASRKPGSVTVPLDFTGLADKRLAIVSERGFSWTGTQFKLQGLDATDSYQPGRPSIMPDAQALSETVVRTDSALMTSDSYGNEVGAFLAEPGTSWHAAVFTSGTGSAFSSTNLPR